MPICGAVVRAEDRNRNLSEVVLGGSARPQRTRVVKCPACPNVLLIEFEGKLRPAGGDLI